MTEVRPVAPEDRKIWETLFQDYAAFYKTQISDDAMESVWQWIFDDDEEFWCDVAVGDNGEVIGFTQYQLMHRSLGGGKVCYLSDLFVLPTARKARAGKAMIDHVIEFAQDNNIPNVRWLTQEFNYSARKLYDHYQPKSDFILYAVPVNS